MTKQKYLSSNSLAKLTLYIFNLLMEVERTVIKEIMRAMNNIVPYNYGMDITSAYNYGQRQKGYLYSPIYICEKFVNNYFSWNF